MSTKPSAPKICSSLTTTLTNRHSPAMFGVRALMLRWVGKPSSTATAVAGDCFGMRRTSGKWVFGPSPLVRSWANFWVDVTDTGIQVSPFTIVRHPSWKPSMVEIVPWDAIHQVEPRDHWLDIEADGWMRATVPANESVAAVFQEKATQLGFEENVSPGLYPGRRVFTAPGVAPDFRLGRQGETPEFRRWVRRSGKT